MSTRKSSVFNGTLIALVSLVAGMVLASRFGETPASFAGPLRVPATDSAPINGALDATTFRAIAHEESPSVVSILTEERRSVQNDDFFGVPFDDSIHRGAQAPTQQLIEGAGSGFVIDKAGYILTNNHVIEDAQEISVVLAVKIGGQDTFKARVVGHDKVTDSALLQLTEMPKAPLTPVRFGDSAQVAPGDWVMAIGNPFTFANTVTVGVVSAVGRVKPSLNPVLGRDLEYIQTDAAINRGNSGGPLLNIRGEVVGINTAIVTDQKGYSMGIGFAVPINTIRDVLPQLRAGKVIRGRIGAWMMTEAMTPDVAKSFGLAAPTGAIVTRIEDGGPAAAAGMQPGDVITDFNGRSIGDSKDLVAMVSATAPGTSVPVRVMRDGRAVSLAVKIGALDANADTTPEPATPPAPVPATPKNTGMGMTIGPLTPRLARSLPKGRTGVVVSDTEADGPADRAGLVPGDIILRINGEDATSVEGVTKALGLIKTNGTAHVLIWRRDDTGTGGSEEFVLLQKR